MTGAVNAPCETGADRRGAARAIRAGASLAHSYRAAGAEAPSLRRIRGSEHAPRKTKPAAVDRADPWNAAMAYFRNTTVNLLNLHYGIHCLALSGGGAFFLV